MSLLLIDGGHHLQPHEETSTTNLHEGPSWERACMAFVNDLYTYTFKLKRTLLYNLFSSEYTGFRDEVCMYDPQLAIG